MFAGQAFLVSLLGQYTAGVLAKEHLETISKFMKAQIDAVLTRIFRCHGNYGVSIFPSMTEPGPCLCHRCLLLTCALCCAAVLRHHV